jgi:hypothetical protein
VYQLFDDLAQVLVILGLDTSRITLLDQVDEVVVTDADRHTSLLIEHKLLDAFSFQLLLDWFATLLYGSSWYYWDTSSLETQ